MRHIITAGLVIAGLTISAGAALSDPKKAIKARQSLMQIYSFNLGKIGAMVKGEMDYDAELAQAFADNLQAAAAMKNSAMWPQGSGNDNPELMELTRALPTAWSTWPAVAEKHKALIAASEAMAKAAGGGLDGLKGAIGDVGKACKGCHQDFRAKKN